MLKRWIILWLTINWWSNFRTDKTVQKSKKGFFLYRQNQKWKECYLSSLTEGSFRYLSSIAWQWPWSVGWGIWSSNLEFSPIFDDDLGEPMKILPLQPRQARTQLQKVKRNLFTNSSPVSVQQNQNVYLLIESERSPQRRLTATYVITRSLY